MKIDGRRSNPLYALASGLVGFDKSTLRVQVREILRDGSVNVTTADIESAGVPLTLDVEQLEVCDEEPIGPKVRDLILGWSAKHPGDPEGLAKWMAYKLRLGSVTECRRMIALALISPDEVFRDVDFVEFDVEAPTPAAIAAHVTKFETEAAEIAERVEREAEERYAGDAEESSPALSRFRREDR